MLRRKRLTAAVVALCALLGATTVAVAGDDDLPRTQRVEASIVFTHAASRSRLCEGPQGPFLEQRVVATGNANGDFAGAVTVRLELLFELATGDGYEQGTLVIRDPASGRKIVDARFDNADIDEISQGSLAGRVRGDGLEASDDGARLFANWRITFGENGSVTAQIGGVALDGRLPAIAISGRCTGPFESDESDIPPPGAAVTATTSHGRWTVIP